MDDRYPEEAPHPLATNPRKWAMTGIVSSIEDGEVSIISDSYHCEKLLPMEGYRVRITYFDHHRSDECLFDDCECHDDDEDEDELT